MVNSDLAGLAHIEMAGVGADISLIRPPTITDSNLLSLFFNGTFYPTDNAEVPRVQHPNFEIGAISRQDVMIHIPETSLQSLFYALAGPQGLNVTEFMLQLADHQLNIESFCRLNQVLCNSGPLDEPINLSIFLNRVASIKLT